MADHTDERAPTPSVLLELREEREVVQEGYRFLDEKRLLLAAELLRQLAEYEDQYNNYLDLNREAAQALAEATARHGLGGLYLYPAATLEGAELEIRVHSFLGVRLMRARMDTGGTEQRAPDAVDPSPEARRCVEIYRRLTVQSAGLAALAGNIERLLEEYRRTERRARALEDVILPEVESALTEVATRLEELDQEEAIRVRLDYSR